MRHLWEAVYIPSKSHDGQQPVSRELRTISGLYNSKDQEKNHAQTYKQNQAELDAFAQRQDQEVGVWCSLLPCEIIRVRDLGYEKNLKTDH